RLSGSDTFARILRCHLSLPHRTRHSDTDQLNRCWTRTSGGRVELGGRTAARLVQAWTFLVAGLARELSGGQAGGAGGPCQAAPEARLAGAFSSRELVSRWVQGWSGDSLSGRSSEMVTTVRPRLAIRINPPNPKTMHASSSPGDSRPTNTNATRNTTNHV